MYNRLRLGEILIKMGKATAENIQAALSYQTDREVLIGQALVEMELVENAVVMQALALQLDCQFEKELDPDTFDLSLLDRLQLGFARDNRALPYLRENNYVFVATDNPLDVEVLDKIRLMVRSEVIPVVVPTAPLLSVINTAFDRKSRELGADLDQLDEAETPHAEEASIDINDLLEAGDDDEAPVIRFVNSLFVQAVRERASDIHIEPGEKEIVVRYRVDGVLKEVTSPPKRFASSIVTRIKIMAGLNIAEKR